MLTGSRPLGFTRPLSTPAIAGLPSSPAKNACTIAAASSTARPSAYGRPASSTSTVARARVEHGVDELLLRSRQVERLGVAALAARAAPEEAGAVAEGEHRRRLRMPRAQRPPGCRRSRRRRRSCRARATISASGNSSRSASSRVGMRMPIAHAGMLRRRRAPGTSSSRASHTGRRRSGRPPRCDAATRAAACRRCETSTSASSARRRARSRFSGRVEVDGSAQRLGRRQVGAGEGRRHRRPAVVEQPEVGLLPEHPLAARCR